MMHFEETRRLLDNSSFLYVIMANMEGCYTYVNKCYETAFHHIHGDIVGQPYHLTMHPDDTKVCHEVAARCFASPDSTFPATIRKHDGNGGFVITQWEYKAVFDENQAPAGIFCIGYDITEHVASHEQLKQAHSVIHHKENILKDISFYQSHIIRRPLANILGLAKIIERMELDQNMRNICSMLIDNSLQLDAVIRESADKTYE